MGEFATGITVVTVPTKEDTKGMTVNAFMSLSLDPTLIAVSISNKASMLETLNQSDKFGISILAEEQQDLSMIFARQKEASQPVEFENINNTPVIKNALVQLGCEKENSVEAGDHTIFIGKVEEIQVREGQPLIYYNGNYQKLTQIE